MCKERKIAIDTMGGDLGPEEAVKGVANSIQNGVRFKLYGDSHVLHQLVDAYIERKESIEIVHADNFVDADSSILNSLKKAKSSSMGMAISAVKNGEADLAISAGNTGILMSLSKIILNTMSGIDRPALATAVPGKNGRSIVLDLGANAECSVRNLVEFAVMGEALARSVFNKENPSISILNIGSESGKGSHLIKDTAAIISNMFHSYIGYIEADKIINGDVDVVVADGFSGNIALKAMEGAARFVLNEFKNMFRSGIISKISAALLMKKLKNMAQQYNPQKHNGAILLGLNGLVVKAHGNSNSVGFEAAIKFAIDVLSDNIFERIRQQLEAKQTTLEQVDSF